MSDNPSYEKLGAFYLGGLYDRETGPRPAEPLLYDSKDLTTHAVCVGMTGSGKTGLCVTLLEEAAIDGVPAICIDPKGDLGNLLLAFPDLAPADFEPWVEPDAAARKGLTVQEFAKNRADLWRKGLASWNQSPERIARFRDAAEVLIYTPGSTAGLPISVLGSFDAPPAALIDNADAMRDRVQATVSGLLALLGIDADPIRSREHILLSNIFHRVWSEGESLDLPGLIHAIQDPPFDSVGVLSLDSFYSADDRFELAMTLNNLLASPGFETWMKGEPLDVAKLLRSPEGKPRISVMSIAHLGDAERMFFVTLLLNEVVSWMRSQRGTSSLRALLYMDEVFGFLPPSAQPPSKLPMLTLLKQARAFGLGVVLATQNPVDLDYKALSNAGTWFLGRLQTERDKMRVLEGLEGASSVAGKAFDRQAMEATLAGLDSRVFLMNNVHEDRPVIFHTRWALSYLAGPLTRTQIRELMAPLKSAASPARVSVAKAAVAAAPAVAAAAPPKTAQKRSDRPIVPPGVIEYFLPAGRGTGQIVYRPALVGTARVAFNRSRPPVSAERDMALLAPLGKRSLLDPWRDADKLESPEPTLLESPVDGAGFDSLPAEATKASQIKTWSTGLRDHLYRNERIEIRVCKALKLTQDADETEGEWKVRLQEACHEARDLAVEKLRRKYKPKLDRMEKRVAKAQDKIEVEEEQYRHSKMNTAVSFGSTILGAIFGRKTTAMTRAGTAAKSASRAKGQKDDVERAKDSYESVQEDMQELEQEFQEELERLKEEFDVDALDVDVTEVPPKKTDIYVREVALVWVPFRATSAAMAPAFEA